MSILTFGLLSIGMLVILAAVLMVVAIRHETYQDHSPPPPWVDKL